MLRNQVFHYNKPKYHKKQLRKEDEIGEKTKKIGNTGGGITGTGATEGTSGVTKTN